VRSIQKQFLLLLVIVTTLLSIGLVAEAAYMPTTTHPIRNPQGIAAVLQYLHRSVLSMSEEDLVAGFSKAGPDAGKNTLYVDSIEQIAILYHATKEPEYARRVAVMLYQFTLVTMDWLVTSRTNQPTIPLRPDWITIGHEMSKIWSTWHFYDLGKVTNLARAYDLIYQSGELERLGNEVGIDMIQHLENYFDYWWKVYTIHFPPYWGNVDGHRIQYMFNYAEALGKPEMVRQAIRWLDNLFYKGYLRDGVWHEGSPSYHNMVSPMLPPIIAQIQGYSDPEGYIDPVEKDRIVNLDAKARWGYLLDRINKAVADLRLPNGKYATIEDTHSKDGGSPLQKSEAKLFPGLGYAILGTGSGKDQFQAHLNFTSPMGHEHLDGLNLLLYANGQEILSEGEYQGDRTWQSSTAGHNTVVVDSRNQYGRNNGVRRTTTYGNRSISVDNWPSIHGHVGNFANLLYYDELSPVMMVEAEAQKLYGNPVTTYSRLIAMIPRPEGTPYVLDIFRVSGGQTHDWMIHGPLDVDYGMTTNVDLGARAGTLHGQIRNLQSARVQQQVTLDIQSKTGVGNIIYLTSGGTQTEVMIGSAPAMRRAANVPFSVVRRSGPQNVFTAIHNPYTKDAFYELQVTELHTPANVNDYVAVEVVGPDFRDVLIATQDAPGKYQVREIDGITAAGRLVWVRFDLAGNLIQALVIGGGSVQVDGKVIMADDDLLGTVLASVRTNENATPGYFDVTGILPQGTQLAERVLVLIAGDGTRHGYRIDQVERLGDNSRVWVRDDPGAIINDKGMQQVFFPNWNIPGTVKYEILGRAASFE
jgi:hypothetical protein